MTARLNLEGDRFGSWTALSYVGAGKWLCRCDCGAERQIVGSRLKSGGSAGCRRCRCGHGTHGGSQTRLYGIHSKMIQRCHNADDRLYHYYGGRGIVVCGQWLRSFTAFRDWALANGYAAHLTLDRRDNDGPYAPENCRWATRVTQARNRRSNRLIEWRGRQRPLAELAEISGVKIGTLWKRLAAGWTVERAVNQPIRRKAP